MSISNKTRPASTTSRHEIRKHMAHPMWNYGVISGATIILLVGGLYMVFSASSVFSYQYFGNSYSLALRQAMFSVVGGLIAWKVSRMSVASIRRWASWLMLFSFLALVAVLVIGESVNGQKNWINLWGPFRFQPSEFAKLGVVLFGAHMMARNVNHANDVKRMTMPLIPVFFIVLLLILGEGDLGTAMVITPIMASTYFFVGAPKSWFVGLFSAAFTGIVGLSVAQPYRLQRFYGWLHQNTDVEGINYQLWRGKYALGSGGIFGLGLGASKEKWGTLPEAHTDFIFAVLGEETGLVGCVVVLVLFIVIIGTGVRVARQATDPFVRFASLGVCTWMATQMATNIGGVLGLMPITGVPLPLVSYGGSSLIPTLAALGMLMSFSRQET
ncbi:MAG: putative lipid II flippase FtsW [Actinomycetes bacterium]